LRFVGQFGFFVQRSFVAAQHVKPMLAQREAVALFPGQLLVAAAAEQSEVPQGQARGLCTLCGGGAQKIDTPAQQLQAQAWPQMNGAQRREHRLQRHTCHARRSQWHEVAGHHHAGITERAAIVTGSMAFHHGNAVSRAHGVMCSGQTDDAAADDDDVFAHAALVLPVTVLLAVRKC
jgi:hypothetical protein